MLKSVVPVVVCNRTLLARMFTFIGIFFFLFFFLGMLRAQAYRWRLLARHYARRVDRPIEKKSMQSGVLVSGSGYNSIKGILNLWAHEDGVSMSIMMPFSAFHKPLFIPYEDIIVSEATWYLDGESLELEFKQCPGVKFVMPKEQVEWLDGFGREKLDMENVVYTKSWATKGWHTFAMVHAGLMLGGMVFLVFLVL